MNDEAEQNLNSLRAFAMEHPLDGQTPQTRGLLIELPLERMAVVALAVARDNSSDERPFWMVSAYVRGAEDPRAGNNLNCPDACKVGCERAIDGVGEPLALWNWDPVTLRGWLKAYCTVNEARYVPESPQLPTDGAGTWYLRPPPPRNHLTVPG